MTLKSATGQDFRCITVIRFGPWPEFNGPNESKVAPPSPAPKAKTFRLIRSIRVGPWSESNGSNELKIGAQGQDFRNSKCSRCRSWSKSDDSTESQDSRAQCQDFRCMRYVRGIRFIRCQRHLNRGGGRCLSLKSWGHFRCIRCIRFGPWSESTESNASKVAPRTLDSGSTRPLQGL